MAAYTESTECIESTTFFDMFSLSAYFCEEEASDDNAGIALGSSQEADSTPRVFHSRGKTIGGLDY